MVYYDNLNFTNTILHYNANVLFIIVYITVIFISWFELYFRGPQDNKHYLNNHLPNISFE